MGSDRERADSNGEEPTVGAGPAAEGMDEPATEEEIRQGDFTQVTQLVWDEWEPSRDVPDDGANPSV